MKTQAPHEQTIGKPCLSLEQKMRLLARKFRAAELRRRKREHRPPCRSESRRMTAWVLSVALVGAVALSFVASAATTTPNFEQANTTFASGNNRAAMAQYEAVLAHDGYSAPVLFNLGNAFFRDGRFAAAILSYERAQVLAPRDRAIATNLRLAREKAEVSAPTLSEVAKAARLISPNALAWIGSIALAAICLSIGARIFRPQFSQSKVVVGSAAIVLLAVATMLAIRWPEFDRAIVTAAKAPARIAPANTAAESFVLKAGEAVTAVKTYGRFVLIRTPDGRSGWVSEKEIGSVFKGKPADGGSA